MTIKRKFFALKDTDEIQNLGEHEDFFGADEAVVGNAIWIFDDETFLAWAKTMASYGVKLP